MSVTHAISGAGAPDAAPPSINSHYTNTSNGDLYLAKGTASVDDWVRVATATMLQSLAVAVEGVEEGLGGKVDKVAGYGLSQENFTAAEKAKLAGLEGSHYRGTFVSLEALESAIPSGLAGDYADVDAGVGDPVQRYIWDASDNEWVSQGGTAEPITASQVKVLYESNPDTNAFTDTEKSKLANLEQGMANPMTVQGDLIVGGAGGAPQRLAKGSDGQVLKMVGGSQVWADEAGGGGGGGGAITRANMVDAINRGALGVSEPEVYAIPGIGAMIKCGEGGIRNGAPWLSETSMNYSCRVGGIKFDPSAQGGNVGLKRGAGAMASGAVIAINGSGSMVAEFAGVLAGVDLADVVDGSFVETNLRLGALSSGSDIYNVEVSLSLPPLDIVRFQYGEDYGSTWEVYWMDQDSAEQTHATSVSASTALTHSLRIEKSGANLLVKMNGTTVLTIPVAEMAQGSTPFGTAVYVGKFGGSAELLIGLTKVSGQLTLTP